MRSLAHIEVISAIDPIVGADAIDVATVLGWKVVVKKGEFNIGDKVIYIEIDSICPDKPQFEFLRNKQFKVKTIKLRGQISQGLIVPIDYVPKKYHKVGTDVTKVLGITKKDDSEAPKALKTPKNRIMKFLFKFKIFRNLFLKKTKKPSTFPSWVKKTDETRIQNIPHILKNKDLFVVTEKLDGCSATYTYKKCSGKYKFVIASRNREADKDSVYYEIANKYGIEHILKTIYSSCRAKDHVTIQGEILGPKIQGNKYSLTEPDFYVFNLIVDGARFGSITTSKIVRGLGLKHVPILVEDYVLPDTVEEMLEEADGKSVIANTLREGLVIRNKADIDHSEGSISFKVVSNKFLLKNNE